MARAKKAKKKSYSVYPCPDMSVQDLINFCTNHNISLDTKICVAEGYMEVFPIAVDEIAVIDNKIVLFDYE